LLDAPEGYGAKSWIVLGLQPVGLGGFVPGTVSQIPLNAGFDVPLINTHGELQKMLQSTEPQYISPGEYGDPILVMEN